ncbi:hypothetical protein [Streptomyces gibsoniae]|uniref:Secreted protein n=1 Tax=Streptomyces gibsoniae TaxID=3075529 RepID=A0ABU2TWK6_9ACTN|nr:hypothetical protein [Streptomyces sp. DSM 41699]MDT0465348.1 hypothetical protein [Streptomyces sp. DSM 41699]
MRKHFSFGLGITLAAASLFLAAPANAAVANEASPANPQTAQGCTTNDDDSKTSCIDVEGHKLTVDRVTADEYYGGGGHHCATPRLYANGSLFATGPKRCATFSVQWTFPINEGFSNHTQLCTSWSDEPGLRPCETVHD